MTKEEAVELLQTCTYFGRSAWEFEEAKEMAIKALTADVPQEMSAREWLMTASKICVNHKCSECPLKDVPCIGDYASHIYTKAEARKAVTIVGKWAREHPERSDT